MKYFSVCALIAITATAIHTQVAQSNNLEQQPGAPDDTTMIGFIFPTKDISDLWLDLTLDQREKIKNQVFE